MSYKYKKIKLKDGSTIDEHRMIMEQYLGRKLDFDEVVHHINGDGRDNRIENLELQSRSQHGKEHGIGRKLSDEIKQKIVATRKLNPQNYPRGTQIASSKLNDEDVRIIKYRLSNGDGVRQISREYNVHHSTISDINIGKGWRHII
jgi:hypothetical protein